ncbi:MFS transporter [Brevibacterium linens]|uniref:Major Facilitator Superfamily protein n=2 Tax=Brevibacterium linens TaxID=1703 RepID=A0A2H1HSE2_BRELN|nr:MFS transporter [Brevibacterium linens]SMX65827.1 Major Facilitator Superfamily protein [Brevibacterium linens]SMX72468.1 Major Facilitator Superfamily protein [Brevibacterium linens ATCC 9172]
MSERTTMTQTQKRILIIGLVPLFMSLLSVSSINVVLPSIAAGIDASTSALQWVLTGYALSFGVVLVAAGRAGDVFGRGQLFVIGVGLFGLSSLVAGSAPDPLTLNISRVSMGLGSGFLNPQVVGLLQQYFQGPPRGRAFGLMGTTVGLSVAIGPVLGGALIALFGSELGWRATFLVNVPFAIASLVLARVWLPAGAWRPAVDEDAKSVEGGRDLDPVGVILLGVGVLLILLPFVESSLGWFIWLSLPAGIGVIWLWAWWERRYARQGRPPMVDLDLFRIRSFSNGAIIIALYFLGVTSVWVLVAIYMQQGLGHTALAAGMIGLPAALCSAVSADVSGRYVFQIGRRLVVWGIALCLLGLLATIGVVALLSRGIGSEWWMLLTLAFIGTAQGMVISPNQTLTLQEVPLRYAGSSGGVLQTGQRIGTSMGLAIMTALAFSITAVSNWHWAMMGAFVVIAVIVILAGVVGLIEVRRGGPRRA